MNKSITFISMIAAAKTTTIESLKVGDTFISKGSKLTLARIKSSEGDKMVFFCLQHALSSCISGSFKKTDIVTLV